MLTENETSEPAYVEPAYELVQASPGKRFANFLIDLIFFYMIVFFWAVIVAIIFPSTIDAVSNNDKALDSFSGRILGLIGYAVVMSLIEVLFHGKSIGKLVTGTRAVNADGSDLTFSKAFARGFARAVPFEAFSALGNPSYPWHDKWTDTYVIDEKQTRLHNQSLKNY